MYLKEFTDLYGLNYEAVKKSINYGKFRDFFEQHTEKKGKYLTLDEYAIEKLKSMYNGYKKINMSELTRIRELLEIIVEQNPKGFLEKFAEKLGLTF